MTNQEGWQKPSFSGAQEGNCVNVKSVSQEQAEDLGMK
jgi:hypothetical protein